MWGTCEHIRHSVTIPNQFQSLAATNSLLCFCSGGVTFIFPVLFPLPSLALVIIVLVLNVPRLLQPPGLQVLAKNVPGDCVGRTFLWRINVNLLPVQERDCCFTFDSLNHLPRNQAQVVTCVIVKVATLNLLGCCQNLTLLIQFNVSKVQTFMLLICKIVIIRVFNMVSEFSNRRRFNRILTKTSTNRI